MCVCHLTLKTYTTVLELFWLILVFEDRNNTQRTKAHFTATMGKNIRCCNMVSNPDPLKGLGMRPCCNKLRIFTNQGFLDWKKQSLGYHRNLGAMAVHKLLVDMKVTIP